MYIIYKITCGDDCYIGSTKNYNQRIKDHIFRATREKYQHLKLYKRINEITPIFSIIEHIECEKEEIFKHEQKYIDEFKPNLNSRKAVEDVAHTRYKNKIKMRNKVYTDEEREKMNIYKKQWYEKNKNRVKEKEYYAINKDAINEKRKKIKITCECGSVFIKRCLIQHQKTKKHLKFISNA